MLFGPTATDMTYTSGSRMFSLRDQEETCFVASSREDGIAHETTEIADQAMRYEGWGELEATALQVRISHVGSLRVENTHVRAASADPVDRARTERIALLARKYENSASVEDIARLDILTERMRRLVPRVTDADLVEAEKIASHMEQVRTDLDAIRKKYGL